MVPNEDTRSVQKQRRLSVTSQTSKKSTISKEERYQKYVKSRDKTLKAIYQQPCIPNTPPKKKNARGDSMQLYQSDLVEDGLDADIDKFSEKQEIGLRKPPGSLKKEPQKPLVTFGKATPLEAKKKREYLKDNFKHDRPRGRDKSGASDRSKLSKVRFADQVSRSPEVEVGDIIDAVDGPRKLTLDSDENSGDDYMPVAVPPRHKPYKELSFKDMKYQRRKQKSINEEQELFGVSHESNDDQVSQSQVSQFSQIRSDLHSWKSPGLKKARPSSAQVKIPTTQVYEINANRF